MVGDNLHQWSCSSAEFLLRCCRKSVASPGTCRAHGTSICPSTGPQQRRFYFLPPSPRIDVLCNPEAITACLAASAQLVSGHDDSAFLSAGTKWKEPQLQVLDLCFPGTCWNPVLSTSGGGWEPGAHREGFEGPLISLAPT